MENIVNIVIAKDILIKKKRVEIKKKHFLKWTNMVLYMYKFKEILGGRK